MIDSVFSFLKYIPEVQEVETQSLIDDIKCNYHHYVDERYYARFVADSLSSLQTKLFKYFHSAWSSIKQHHACDVDTYLLASRTISIYSLVKKPEHGCLHGHSG